MDIKRFFQLASVLVVASGLLFVAACDDNGGDDPPDTTVTDTVTDTTTPPTDTVDDATPDTMTPDQTECCTPAECAAQGQVCNPTTCMCEVAGTNCTAVDQTCDLEAAQPAEYVCLEMADGTGLCRQTCQTTGGADPCPQGAMCIEETAGAGGWCEPSECTHFFDNDCETGFKCVPYFNGAHFCVANGLGQEDDACQGDDECANGLICAGYCAAPDCSALSPIQPCPSGMECGGWTLGEEALDIGQCFSACQAWVDGECESGEWCFPGDRVTSTGRIEGMCSETQAGTANPGDSCGVSPPTAATTCVDGSMCVGVSDTAAECFQLCDPETATTGVGGCPTGQACTQVTFSDGSTPDWGICEDSCIPYTEESGCEAPQVCMPDFDHQGVGFCYNNTGTAIEGATCDEDTPATSCDLSLGLMCIGGTCEILCDPTATTGTPGICPDGANGVAGACSALGYTDETTNEWVTLAIGACAPGCEYQHGNRATPTIACDNADEWCHPGELGDSLQDFCAPVPEELTGALAHLEACPGTMDFGYYCMPGGICMAFDANDPLLCYELCTAGGGALPGNNNIDCETRPDAYCSGFTATVGYCGYE